MVRKGPSTWYWIKQVFQYEEAHNEVLEMMEKYAEDEINKKPKPSSQDNAQTSNDNSEPINIICLDGGGSKGYATISMAEEIESIYQSMGAQKDFLSKFDLIAGTSVGGCAALTVNRTSTTDDAIINGTYFLDMAREHAFANLNLVRLMFTGSATKATQQPAAFAEKVFGKNAMLRNEIGLKAFAVAVAISDSDLKKGKKPKPFLLRTYDIPTQENELIKGTSSLKLSEAIQGTSSAPVAFDRVRVEVDDETYTLCDGGLSCNCPISLAIAEAKRLYPGRKFGTILSIGLDPSQDRFAYRAIDLARVHSPSLHFQRILPPMDIIKTASAAESDIYKIAKLENHVRKEIRNNPGLRLQLKTTMKNLLESPSRRIINKSEDKRRIFQSAKSKSRSSLKSIFDEEFLRRQQIRKEIKEGTLERKNSHLQDNFVDDHDDDLSLSSHGKKQITKRVVRNMVAHPLVYIIVTLLFTLAISLICVFFSGFELVKENKKGWKSRGTMIGSRAMQADLIRNNTNILFQEGSEVFWEEMTSSVAEGYFPIKDQLSRRFSLPLNKVSSQLQLSSRSLQGQCSDDHWYSSELLFKQNNMVALLEAKDVSLLDPIAVRSICKAEVSNKAILENEDLCDYCSSVNPTCLFPLSLVRVIRSYIGDSNHLPCDDLAQVYEDVQDTFTQQLLDCANELKDNLGEIGGNTTCPLEFSAMMVDKDFGVEGNSFLKYSASIYPTSSVDSLDLFNKVEELSLGDENIGIIYESHFDNFEEHAIDEAVKADLFFAAGSALMVIAAITIFTGSLWLVCVGLLQIILAIPLAYAIYRFIFGLRFFSLLNLIGFFVSAALGADDLFVAVEKFKQVRFRLGNTASTEDVAMIALPEAAFGMLLTTATTSIAFFATCVSPVAPIYTFSMFCGLMVLMNYVLNIFLVFPALCCLDQWTRNGSKNCFLQLRSLCKRKQNKDTQSSQSGHFFSILDRYYKLMHKFRWILLILNTILFGFATYYALQITAPKDTAVQMLPYSHPLEKHNRIENENLLSSEILKMTTGSNVEIVFGVSARDTGNKNLPDSLSTLELDDSFNPSSASAQLYLASFCDRLFELPFAYKSDGYKCSMNDFQEWLWDQSQLPQSDQDLEYKSMCNGATDLPMDENNFEACMIAWSKSTSDSSVLSWENEIKIMTIHLGTKARFDMPLEETRQEWEKFEEFQEYERKLISPPEINFFHSASLWWWNDTYATMRATGLSSLYIAISFSALIVLFTSKSMFLSFVSALSICFILAISTATLVFLGWELGFLEWICFAILVGLSADFVIHLSHSYCHAHGKHPREERTMSAIMSMGTSILGATMTTFSVSVLMLFCQVLFFVKFAQLLIVTIAFSLYGGLVFFSVIVDCFGPDEPLQTYAKLKSTLWKDKKATIDSVSEKTESNLPPSQTPRNYAGEINRIQRRLSTLTVNSDFTSSGDSHRIDAAAMSHNQDTNTSSSLTVSSSSPKVSNSSKDNLFGLEESGHVTEVELRQATLTKLYRVDKMLGSGSFSTVRQVFGVEDQKMYAAKMIKADKLSDQDRSDLQNEIFVLQHLKKHKNAITLFDFFQDSTSIYLITECVLGGELFDRIASKEVYTEIEARNTCRSLLSILAHLDLYNIVHRDLKPENILLVSKDADADIKLIDFGFAKMMKDGQYLTTQCGTPTYVSPEILNGIPYGTKSDMWSFGVIMYTLLFGYPPFLAQDQRKCFEMIKGGIVEYDDGISSEAKSLLMGLLNIDPKRRLSASEVFQSPWIVCSDEGLIGQELDLKKFCTYNAKRKLRRAVLSVIATSKLTSLGCQWRSCNAGNYDSSITNSENSGSDSKSNSSRKSEEELLAPRFSKQVSFSTADIV